MGLDSVRARVARRLSAIPLRIGLVLVLVVLAASALVISGGAVTSALSRTLTARADEQLTEAARTWAMPQPMKQQTGADGRQVWVPAVGPAPQNRSAPTVDQPRRYYEIRTGANGEVYWELDASAPAVGSRPLLAGVTAGVPKTVTSQGDSTVRWRVLSTTNEYGTTTIAMPLDEQHDTVIWLLWFQAGTGAVVLALLGAAGYFVVGRSLRPLRKVEETAAAIAGGDLDRRVPVRGVDTEVDHLARSLNIMLGRIQQGVAETEASEEAARRSESRMRRFVADASHELRTPLTSIRGFAELYHQGALPDTDVVLARIEGEAARMSVLVEDLLMLARLDARRPLEHAPVDLLSLAGDAVHNARAADARHRGDGPAREIGLEVRDGVGTLEVTGDQSRLRQVLANLLGNASTHTPPGTPITVALTPWPEQVRIDVIDRGPGLSASDQARVFERFYRTDRSRTRASGGSGLGLSIVSALVDAHGGTVSVDSVPGEGARFTVVLPRTRSGVGTHDWPTLS